MAPSKGRTSKTESSEKKLARKIRDKLRYEKKKSDPVKSIQMTLIYQERYRKRKEKGQVKSVKDMTEREKRMKRKQWRKNNRASRQCSYLDNRTFNYSSEQRKMDKVEKQIGEAVLVKIKEEQIVSDNELQHDPLACAEQKPSPEHLPFIEGQYNIASTPELSDVDTGNEKDGPTQAKLEPTTVGEYEEAPRLPLRGADVDQQLFSEDEGPSEEDETEIDDSDSSSIGPDCEPREEDFIEEDELLSRNIRRAIHEVERSGDLVPCSSTHCEGNRTICTSKKPKMETSTSSMIRLPEVSEHVNDRTTVWNTDPVCEPKEEDLIKEGELLSRNVPLAIDELEGSGDVVPCSSTDCEGNGTICTSKKLKLETSISTMMRSPEIAEHGKDRTAVWDTQPRADPCTITLGNNIVNHRVKTTNSVTSPIDCFKAFISSNILDIIHTHTNIKIQTTSMKMPKQQGSCLNKYLYKEELQAFIGLIILASVTKKNHFPVEMLYDTMLCGDRYTTTLAMDRFKAIAESLKFNSKAIAQSSDKFGEISEIWKKFTENCKNNYEPSSFVAVGEQIVRFRGKCGFRVFKPKLRKRGLKLMFLCDQGTQYIINALPYFGKGSVTPNVPAANYFMKQLVEPLKGSYRNVTASSWFSSIELAEELLRDYKLTYLGSLQKNKSELPLEITDANCQNRQVGSSIFVQKGNLTVVSYKKKKNKLVTLVSTMQNKKSVNELNGKPEIMLNYQNNRRAVDTFNQMCQFTNVGLDTDRWPVCMFYNMLNIACANAYVLYVYNFHKKGEGTPLSRFQFMVQLSNQLTSPWMLKRLEFPIPQPLRGLIRERLGLKPDASQEQVLQKRTYSCRHCHPSTKKVVRSVCAKCNQSVCSQHLKRICHPCFNKFC